MDSLNSVRRACAVRFTLTLCLLLAACAAPLPGPGPAATRALPLSTPGAPGVPTATPSAPAAPAPTVTLSPVPSPTSPRRAATTPLSEPYVVEAGETLSQLAARYEIAVTDLAHANGLDPSAALEPGLVLMIPVPESHVGSDALLLPDSGLLNGPGAVGFDVAAFAQGMPGYLKRHSELIEDRVTMTGPEIVEMVARRHSVDPRLLLAALEYRSRWLSDPAPTGDALRFAAGKPYDETDPQQKEDYGGLFGQIAWVANRLNAGYYGWKSGAVSTVEFADGTHAYLAAGLNAGTAGVQYFLSVESDWPTWQAAVRPGGFMQTYVALFGDPWPRAAGTVPEGLVQPEFALPWARGETWYLSGGPHRAWGPDTPWASLDFVADPEPIGCVVSAYWARAITPGLVTRIDYGQVVVDLDGDGEEGTGWMILYMHMAPEGRVSAGTRVQTGDPIGHPSCEGGRSTGAHLHISRRYNGEWLRADGPVPFVMDGWTPVAGSQPYDGFLQKGSIAAWACTCRTGNLITAGP